MDCHFRDLPTLTLTPTLTLSLCLGTMEIGQIPKMTVHKKLLIKWKVLNQIWWFWCYYNKEKMLYLVKWKKITVDQSKVLKIRLYRLFRFYWATRYICVCVLVFEAQVNLIQRWIFINLKGLLLSASQEFSFLQANEHYFPFFSFSI